MNGASILFQEHTEGGRPGRKLWNQLGCMIFAVDKTTRQVVIEGIYNYQEFDKRFA